MTVLVRSGNQHPLKPCVVSALECAHKVRYLRFQAQGSSALKLTVQVVNEETPSNIYLEVDDVTTTSATCILKDSGSIATVVLRPYYERNPESQRKHAIDAHLRIIIDDSEAYIAPINIFHPHYGPRKEQRKIGKQQARSLRLYKNRSGWNEEAIRAEPSLWKADKKEYIAFEAMAIVDQKKVQPKEKEKKRRRRARARATRKKAVSPPTPDSSDKEESDEAIVKKENETKEDHLARLKKEDAAWLATITRQTSDAKPLAVRRYSKRSRPSHGIVIHVPDSAAMCTPHSSDFPDMMSVADAAQAWMEHSDNFQVVPLTSAAPSRRCQPASDFMATHMSSASHRTDSPVFCGPYAPGDSLPFPLDPHDSVFANVKPLAIDDVPLGLRQINPLINPRRSADSHRTDCGAVLQLSDEDIDVVLTSPWARQLTSQEA